jgi:hypothetical protein
MSYDPNCATESNKMSCQRQLELAKYIEDQQTSKLQYMILNPACSRLTQMADRVTEHNLTLGKSGVKMNNSFCRVTPQVSILDYPQRCLKNFN